MTRVLLALVLSLALLVPAGSALAVAPQDFPAQAPENHLVDGADVLSNHMP